MLLKVARELLTIIANVSLMCMPLACMLGICIHILSLAIGLLFDPGFIETNYAFLELLVVSNVLDDLENIIIEAFLEKCLHVKFVTAV